MDDPDQGLAHICLRRDSEHPFALYLVSYPRQAEATLRLDAIQLPSNHWKVVGYAACRAGAAKEPRTKATMFLAFLFLIGFCGGQPINLRLHYASDWQPVETGQPPKVPIFFLIAKRTRRPKFTGYLNYIGRLKRHARDNRSYPPPLASDWKQEQSARTSVVFLP